MTRNPQRICRFVGIAILLVGSRATGNETAEPVNFLRDIRPILARNCFLCHGPDEGSRVSEFRVDQADSIRSELESGGVPIVPGHPDQSEVYQRLTADAFSRMPPEDSGHHLTRAQIELIGRWIAQGAPYEGHWSFQPIQRPDLPAVTRSSWPRNEIDDFILSRLEQQQIEPAPEADRQTLIRRLSLDLIGLPPSPQEVDAYLQDESDSAYEHVVDRLLESPHFGERWGRHWLDLARYADSDGYLGDDLRPDAYRYRDWVIDAINRDLPFDEFTTLQLAGDLVDDATLADQTATGFHRNAMKNTEAGADRELDRVNRTVDRVSTVGTVWLGLTVGCAECHSHKYDPISQREFYELFAFFNQVDDVDIPAPSPAEVAAYETNLEVWTTEQDNVKASLRSLTASNSGDLRYDAIIQLIDPESTESASDSRDGEVDELLARVSSETKDVLEKYTEHLEGKPEPPESAVLAVGATEKARTTHVHIRGDYRQHGERVDPGTPAVLPELKRRGDQPDRLDLARWIVAPDNPLPARTTVNHFWKHLFGRGLVSTVDNFGVAGESPTHPLLLDWLASEFQTSGWSRKQIIRLIVTSATYRQSSDDRPEMSVVDPYNTLLARQSRFRVESEIVRDLALASSGLLDRSVGGPSIRPPMRSHLTEVSRNRQWEVSTGSDRYRRGMYILFRRATPYPTLVQFDSPDSSVTCAMRERSNSPLQALTLLNDPVFFECATHTGLVLARLGDIGVDQWIDQAFRAALGRTPSPTERQRLVELYEEYQRQLAAAADNDVRQLIGDIAAPDVSHREQAARVLVARSLMNLDEFITRD